MRKSSSGKVGKRKSRLKKNRTTMKLKGKKDEHSLRSMRVSKGQIASGEGPIDTGTAVAGRKIAVPTYKNYNKQFFKSARGAKV